MNKRTLIALSAAIVMAAAPVAANPVAAQGNQQANQQNSQSAVQPLVIPVTTTGKGAAGSEKVLSTNNNVPNGEYQVKVESQNQESVHPNTDMVVRSGGQSVEVKDIESAAFKAGTAQGTLKVADGKVAVSVRFGKDGVFSGGVKVILTQVTPPAQPPATPPTPPTPPATPPVPVAPAETPKPETPAPLPATGSASVVGSVVGLSLIGYTAYYLYRTKRRLSRFGR